MGHPTRGIGVLDGRFIVDGPDSLDGAALREAIEQGAKDYQGYRLVDIVRHEGNRFSLIWERGYAMQVEFSESASAVLNSIIDRLYLDMDGTREFYSPDKEWSSDEIEDVARLVKDWLHLRPHDDDCPVKQNRAAECTCRKAVLSAG
jgi:hypothetical protein